jgi:Pyruvate/2-oxoacid:ferredoxin oxidoreductase gamma subunit
VDVITGALEYPDIDDLKKIIAEHAKEAKFIDATDMALKVKTPILANIIMLGAFSAWHALPLSGSDFEEAIKEQVPKKHLEKNLEAFKEGVSAVAAQ